MSIDKFLQLLPVEGLPCGLDLGLKSHSVQVLCYGLPVVHWQVTTLYLFSHLEHLKKYFPTLRKMAALQVKLYLLMWVKCFEIFSEKMLSKYNILF